MQKNEQLINVSHTHTFRNTKPQLSARPDPEGNEVDPVEQQNHSAVGEAEVLEGHIAETPVNLKVADDNEGDDSSGSEDGSAGGANVDADMADFEDENGNDGEKALEYTRTLKIEFDPAEVEFWFTQIENEMYKVR